MELLAKIVNKIELEIKSSELPSSDERECSQLCEYLFTMNKGLEEVRGWDRPLLRQLSQINLDGK
ncbi:1391_t:CDS:2, partial [Gigaspora margarita]